MTKEKKSRRRTPAVRKPKSTEQDSQLDAQPAQDLVPVPSAESVRVEVHGRSFLIQLAHAMRAVASAMIDIADATADSLTKRLEGSA